MRLTLFAAATLVAVSVSSLPATSAEQQLAQVEVIESSPIRALGQPREGTNTGQNSAQPSGNANIQSELYYQLQILQQEVQALRGLVEEQAYEIQQLKQRQMDDYVDLDRRLSQLSQTGGATAGTGGDAASRSPRSSSPAPAATAPGGAQPAEGEFESYSAAVDLATKQQQFDRAIQALQAHLQEYPDGSYAANAYYWLGQIQFVQGNMEEARQAFNRVVEAYPEHNKASEARYKLGQVYFRLGDRDRARSLLQQVADGNSDSAPLARNFLQQNFSQ